MEQLPVDILEAILIFLDAKELCQSCRLVCKSWRDTIDSPSFWILKCKSDGAVFPDVKDTGVQLDFKRICHFKPYSRNFISNWSASEGMKGWTVGSQGGNGWDIEPVNCNYADPLTSIGIHGLNKCWVTSYWRCVKQQTIDLEKSGVQPEVMDKVKPAILISDFTTPRGDCGSVYELEVELLDARRRPLHKYSRQRAEPQWSGAHWKQVLIRIEDYPEGVRHVLFQHGGKDSQFWAGHYGPKMAGSVVRVLADPTALPWDTDTRGEIEFVDDE